MLVLSVKLVIDLHQVLRAFSQPLLGLLQEQHGAVSILQRDFFHSGMALIVKDNLSIRDRGFKLFRSVLVLDLGRAEKEAQHVRYDASTSERLLPDRKRLLAELFGLAVQFLRLSRGLRELVRDGNLV